MEKRKASAVHLPASKGRLPLPRRPAAIGKGDEHAFAPFPHREISGERGAEMLEFALVFAMLMMLLLGLVVFARAYNVYETITRAAREGARMAALPSSAYDQSQGQQAYIDNKAQYVDPASSAIFEDYIKPVLQAGSLNPGAVTNYNEQVTWLDPNDSYEQCGVIISFQYPYRLNIPFLDLGLTTIYLNANVRMRLENANYQSNGSGTYSPSCP
jgi:hypothetical protein